jgi:chromosomal replication initiation ATPase DnaA
VLLTAAAEPGAWGLTTPDLLSRLRLAPQVALETPDDALMRAALLKLFFDRQLSVDEGVIETLALHLDRSLDAARTVVAALDARSLAERRRITRGMAREAVQIAGLDWQQEFFADGAEDG